MSECCPICQTPYGKRRRCYVCHPGKSRTGEERTCKVCGKRFYAQRNQIADTARNQATYCSNACKYQAMKALVHPWAKPNEKTVHSRGYILVWAPDHPRASRGRVFEHILVAERMLGRYLEPWERVHHRNGDKQDNSDGNIQVMTQAEHRKLHPQERHTITLVCQICGRSFEDKPSRAARKFCSMECRRKSWPFEMAEKRRLKRQGG